MRKLLNICLAGSAVAAGLWIISAPSFATVDYGKKEKLACTFCHPPGKLKELTDAGKYYKDHEHSMKGYVAKEEQKKK